jgi:alkyl hydroperoxide reductase subunit F
MSELIDEKTKQSLRGILAKLQTPVRLLFFTQQSACPACSQQRQLLEELASLTSKLELKAFDFVLDADEARKFTVDKIPATAVVGRKDFGIRFYGLTAGYEFTSLLEAVLMVSTEQSGLDPPLEALVQKVTEPVHIQVVTTLTCPYCPKMVHVANQLALVNDNIRADMIEGSEFPQLVQKYDVTGVPKTIINELYSFEGALPFGAVYLEILKAVNPEEYRRLREVIREAQRVGEVKKTEEDHMYEVIVIGGGPAAMSATLYAARKGLDVAVVALKVGGQISYTGPIENYLGLPGITGGDMTEAFRNHVEKYPIAEALGVNVVQVEKKAEGFAVMTADDRHFRARSIIYCAGKEYRRLGVPGEDRFIGRGIAFCATCDAPLYRGKRVAVVGGGNSALTAARDLLSFASEIHLIHRRSEFKAEAALLQEVSQTSVVTVHTPMVVRSFLGKDKLTGIRLESSDGKKRLDLSLDGVFLEIGLTPNTQPVKGLIEVNGRGEIPIKKDLSTAIPAFFAAGDVTDIAEKQISIAVGQGALAALSAHRYLVKNKLTRSPIGLKESWQ